MGRQIQIYHMSLLSPCMHATLLLMQLDALMTDDSLADVPILVLGNKIDVPQAASEEELRAYMGLRETYGKSGSGSQTRGRPLEVFMCSVLRGQGFKDGFQWLEQFL